MNQPDPAQQDDWGLLRETVVRRTQASGASREDAEDATQDALAAAIGTPRHPHSQAAWLTTVARRRNIDSLRRRVREQRVVPVGMATGSTSVDPTSVGPEEVVVERAHASWLAASLTQLPPTTREVVDAVGSGMATSEVARSMNLSPRSVESHLTRARRHLRRLGALALPVGAGVGWLLRPRTGARTTSALAVAVPVLAGVVVLLPSSTPVETPGDPALAAPVRELPPLDPELLPLIPDPPGLAPVGPPEPDASIDPSVPPTAAPAPSPTPESPVAPDPGTDTPPAAGTPGAPGVPELPRTPQECQVLPTLLDRLRCTMADVVERKRSGLEDLDGLTPGESLPGGGLLSPDPLRPDSLLPGLLTPGR